MVVCSEMDEREREREIERETHTHRARHTHTHTDTHGVLSECVRACVYRTCAACAD